MRFAVVRGNHEDIHPVLLKVQGLTKLDLHSLITNAVYLENEMVVIEGIKIFGSNWCVLVLLPRDGSLIIRCRDTKEAWDTSSLKMWIF